MNNEWKFRPGNPSRRLRAISLILVAVLALFTLRLIQVQVIDGGALAQRAEATRLATTTLTAPRGAIYDSRGVVLAESVEGRNIIVDQTLVDDVVATADSLAAATGLPADQLRTTLAGDAKFAYVARNLTPEQADAVMALELPGIATEKTMRREYPAGELGAGVLGFVGVDGHGLAGVELAYDEQLSGEDGLRQVEVADGKLIPTGTDVQQAPVPGEALQLTIDRDLQWVAQSAITRQVQASGAQSGTVIVMEARTGKIRAMASAPSFDPNNPEQGQAENLQNRAVVEAFEPGSTSKLITAASAINEGAVDPGTVFTVPSKIFRGTNDFNDYSPHPTYDMTLAGIIATSSNTGSIMTAERIGAEKFREYMLRFGLGETSGIGLPGETTGYVPPLDQWTDSTFPTLSFGQGFSVSAVQITSVFQTIANNGVRIDPTVVEAVTSTEGTTTAVSQPEQTEVVSEAAADAVLRMMEGVVTDDGTAKDVEVPGYRVAGKTGTANRIDDSCGCYRGYTSSFIGIAPADDPELIVAVIVQDPKTDYRGSSNGVPVFNEVMSTALQMMRIPPTGAVAEPLPLYANGSGPDSGGTEVTAPDTPTWTGADTPSVTGPQANAQQAPN